MEELRSSALDLLRLAETACVTTLNEAGHPDTRAMFNLRNARQFPGLAGLFARHGDDFATFFTTNTASGKVAAIQRNPVVSAYYCLPSQWRGLMLGGEVAILQDRELKEQVWQTGWERYYPQGCHDPDHTVLVFRPTRVKYYHQMRSVVLAPGTA